VVLAISGLILCITQKSGEGADNVRVAYTSPSETQGLLWVADVGGLFRKNGLDVQVIYTRLAIESLVAGGIDFGQMTGSLMSSAKLQGSDAVMLAGVQDVLNDRLVSRPNIKSIEELRGKRIGIFRFGAASHLRVLNVLPRCGMTDPDVTFFIVRIES
jgi:ABC-type nitrate/sulfonate/bicarbonate transport system substrate-binding protein